MDCLEEVNLSPMPDFCSNELPVYRQCHNNRTNSSLFDQEQGQTFDLCRETARK